MDLQAIFATLNSVSPIAIIALLSWVIYLLVARRGPIKQLGSNHLHAMPEIVEMLRRIEQGVQEIRSELAYLRGRINGRS